MHNDNDEAGKKREKILKMRRLYQAELKKNLAFFSSARKPIRRHRVVTQDSRLEGITGESSVTL